MPRATIGLIAANRRRAQGGGPPPSGFVAGDWGTVVAEFDGRVGVTDVAGAVSAWADQSGNGHHVTQATAGNKPVTGSATQNGMNGILSDGGDWLDSASFTLAQPYTVVTVVKYISVGGGGSIYYCDSAPGGSSNSIGQSNASGLWSGNFGSAVSGGTANLNCHTSIQVANGASSVRYIDGVSVYTTNPGTNGITHGIRLFNRTNGTSPTVAAIFHHIYYSGTPADIAGLEDALNDEWAVH